MRGELNRPHEKNNTLQLQPIIDRQAGNPDQLPEPT
jgi:hypothetical protein